MFVPTLPMALVSPRLAARGEVILTVGVLNMRQEFGPLAHQMTTAAEQLAGRAHLGWIDRGHREHAPAQQHGALVSVTLSVLGLAPRKRLHRERRAQHKGEALAGGTESGEPVPGEEALYGHDEVVTGGGHDAPAGFRCRGQVLVDEDRPRWVEEADGQGTGVESDAAVLCMWLGVEPQCRLPPWG